MENRTSNFFKDDEVKEIEFLTRHLKLTEDASSTALSVQDEIGSTVSAQDESGSTVSAQNESDSTMSAQDESCSTVSAQDERDSTVSAQDESGSTVSAQDDSIATMIAKTKPELKESNFNLQKIAAEKIKNATFRKAWAILFSKSTNGDPRFIEIYEVLFVALLNQFEKNARMNEYLMHDFKELFGQMLSVLQYVMSTGTSHLPIVSKKEVFKNLIVIRQEVRYRIEWLNKVRSDLSSELLNVENFLQFSDRIESSYKFSQIERAYVIVEKSRTLIIAMKSLLEVLGKYDGDASTTIECIAKELFAS